MKKTLSFFLLIILFSSLLSVPPSRVEARPDLELSDTLETNMISKLAGPTYNLSNPSQSFLTTDRVGYLEFNVSDIPDTAIVNRVTLEYYAKVNAGQDANTSFRQLTEQPSLLADNNATNYLLYSDILGNDIYVTTNFTGDGAYHQYSTELTGATNDVNLTGDYFTVGFNATASVGYWWYYAHSSYDPVLVVHYSLSGDYEIPFIGTYYENGTKTTDTEVTASLDTGNEQFTVGNTTEFYPILPGAWYWDIGGGYSRFIYGVGNESLTITYPDDTDYTYSFLIKDLTGNVGTDSFLEAYRTINGSETLITRMPIDQPNAVPMNLVFGKTYYLKIRYGSGSTYNWGFFIPGSDTSITLLLRTVEFTDGAQILYNYITVEGLRNAGTITVNYLDARANTVWANVSIRIRNGAEVATYTRNNDSYLVTYTGFNDSLGYIATVTGEHSDFGAWGRTFILDQSFEFPDSPELGGVFGSVSQNLLPFFLVCVTILIFPVNMQPIGLIGGAVMATMLSFFNWTTWSNDLLYFIWFIAIIINLTGRGRG